MVAAERTVPQTIYGVRLPQRVFVLSDRCPKSGSIKSATTLSAAMTRPRSVLLKLKMFSSTFGIMLSYTCQNRVMEKNAKPTRTVDL